MLSDAPIVIDPALVKLGDAPDWMIERLPLTRLIAPLLVCTAPARLRVSERCSVSVP